jgi:hypothetical protein
VEPVVAAAVAGAAVPGVVALVLAVVLAVRVRRGRAAQAVLLPDGTTASLVDRQADLQREIAGVRATLDDLRALVDRQAEYTARQLATVLRFQGLVRYDAYRDMGGSQSWSIALVDENRDGTVLSCLHARDHARVYVKEITGGTSAQRLSPEEERAIAIATGAAARQAAA